MTPEQVVALLLVLADLRIQVAQQAAEIAALRAAAEASTAVQPDSPRQQVPCGEAHPGQDIYCAPGAH